MFARKLHSIACVKVFARKNEKGSSFSSDAQCTNEILVALCDAIMSETVGKIGNRTKVRAVLQHEIARAFSFGIRLDDLEWSWTTHLKARL